MTSLVLRPQSCPPVNSVEVAARAGAEHRGAQVSLTGITNRSGEVQPGDLYVGVRGTRAHGAQFAAEAVASGAVAVLTDLDGLDIAGDLGVPVLVAGDVRRATGPASAAVYGDPSRRLTMLGITGTSGKTTTAYMVRAILQAAGRPSGLLGTVETIIGEEHVGHAAGAALTTPEAPELQALLAVMVERGIGTVVMEVSSHSLQLRRVDGIEYAVAAFLNLSQDHLDFHDGMEDYFAAKSLLFDGRARTHVINVDDDWATRLAETGRRTVRVSPAGRQAADWRIEGAVAGSSAGSAFVAVGPDGRRHEVLLSLPGDFNADNAVMAMAIAAEAGVDADLAAGALREVRVPGRMERIDAGQPFLAVVDYSHKPAAVEAALRSVRDQVTGRVLLVLGCGGDRDAAKRPLMGAVGARDADLLVITDDNPRSEDPAAIRSAMLRGVQEVPQSQRGEVVEIGDRAEAIRHAVRAARDGDVVLVAGKGHETGQYVGGVVHDFDDRAALRQAIGEREA